MTRKSVQGFTIVELLIVIVVIAILAAITVAAYNGIQNRSRTSAGATNASSILKKAELFNSLYSGGYPTYCQLVTNTVAPTGTPTSGTGLGASTPCVAGGASTGTEVAIGNISGLTMIAVTSTTSANGSVVTYIKCPAVGAKVGYWDSTIGTPAIAYKTIGDQAGC